MKKGLLGIIFCVSVSAYGQTSIYHPFPDSGAVWNVHLYSVCFFSVYEKYYSYTISADTTINGNNYHMLWVPAIVWTGCSGNFITPGYSPGYFRQDISNRKIYFVSLGDTAQQLLYDFNLLVGDTITGYLAPCTPEVVTVINIDSIFIDGNYRKRWKTSTNPSWNDNYIIEGIGSQFGLLDFICSGVESPATHLVCYKEQNNILYHPDTSFTCEVITSLQEYHKNLSSIILFPNPATSELKIESGKLQIELVEIYDVVGEKIKDLTPNPSPAREGNASIDVSGLSAGIYFVRMRTENGIAAGKFIKQ